MARARSSGAVRVLHLSEGHLDTQQGGAGDRTSDHPVTSQPALPPEPHVAHRAVFRSVHPSHFTTLPSRRQHF